MKADPEINDYQVLDEHKKSAITVRREEFFTGDHNQKEEDQDQNNKTVKSEVIVSIVKASFDKKLKWDFAYEGNKISAYVTDPDFQIRIDKGESFSKGDCLLVDLETTSKWDESIKAALNTYKIIKVQRHIKPPEQKSFP